MIVTREHALSSGLMLYFTGVPCKFGHVDQRYVIGTVCVSCKAARGLQWRTKNPDYATSYHEANIDRLELRRAERYAENKDQAKADAIAWSKANPERKAATSAAWRLANADMVSMNKRAWQEANPESHLAAQIKWRLSHPEKSRSIVRRRRAKKLNAGGSHTVAEIEALLVSQGYQCVICYVSIRDRRHLDHIHPISKGGSDDISNLQWLCPGCNYRKGDKDPVAFAKSLADGLSVGK